MSCRRYERPIALSVSGDLSPRRETGLQRHLASCPACRDAEAAMRQTRAALSALPDIADDPTLDARVFEAIQRLDAIESPRRRMMTTPRFAVVAMAVIALTAASAWWRHSIRAPDLRIPVATTILSEVHATRDIQLSDLLPPLTGEKQEVIKMYTDDPTVVFYLVADARGEKTP